MGDVSVSRWRSRRTGHFTTKPINVSNPKSVKVQRIAELDAELAEARERCRTLSSTTAAAGTLIRHIHVPHGVPESPSFTYEHMLGPYTVGVSSMIITEPYLGTVHQVSNLRKFMNFVKGSAANLSDVDVHTLNESASQQDFLKRVTEECAARGVQVRIKFCNYPTRTGSQVQFRVFG